MITLSSKATQQLRDLGVIALYLFGSRAQDNAGPLSDYDFAVLISDPQRLCDVDLRVALYDYLYDILLDVCAIHGDTIIDIVFLQGEVSLELQALVVREGKLLMDTNPLERVAYEERVMVKAADFTPILRMIDKAILDSL